MPTLRPAIEGFSGTSATNAVLKPSGTVAGDLMLAFHAADSLTSNMDLAAGGGAPWSVLYTHPSGTGEKVYGKIANGSEPSSYTASNTATSVGGLMHLISIANPINTTLPTVLKSSDATGTAVPTPSLTSVGSTDIDIRWLPINFPASSVTSYSITTPAGYTSLASQARRDATLTYYRIYSVLYDRDNPPSGSTGAVSFTGTASATDSGYSILIPSLLASTGFTGWGMPV